MMAEHKMTKKQLKAQRIEVVYQTMNADRVKEIDNRIREIASGYEMDLEPAMDEAADEVADHFDKLLAEGFTPDEVEAVLQHHRRDRLTFFSYRATLNIWKYRWLLEHDSKTRAS